jgi:hypothetical protein
MEVGKPPRPVFLPKLLIANPLRRRGMFVMSVLFVGMFR